jgi:para-aminobenzoate synthetase component 1
MNSRIKIKSFPWSGDFFSLIKPVLEENGATLLDSCADFGSLGRYSFLGFEPFAHLTEIDGRCCLRQGKAEPRYYKDAFTALETVLSQYALEAPDLPVPFAGGAMGYFSYDLGRLLEILPEQAKPKDSFPGLCMAFYDTVMVCDNESRVLHLCASDPLNRGVPDLNGKMDALERLLDSLRLKLRSVPAGAGARDIAITGLKSNFTRESYCGAVEKILDYIARGDIFQANLSQAFQFSFNVEPWRLFERLRSVSPAPFSAFMNLGERSVVSSSPERFLRLTRGTVETRPIKGTRPRGKTPDEDRALSSELIKSGKDRAELLMIVDLERNDLGRVARFGSVEVTELAALETYANVFHLVATVKAELAPGRGAVDLIRATFPGGSITGAPKIRAMEIIEELEPYKRSLYTGSLGYIGFNGDMDLNILIRTILTEANQGRFQVGGGIVADSVPALEYEETLDKAAGMLNALGKTKEVAHG